MTRKQAIDKAIEALAASGRNEEAIGILHKLSAELPFFRWSEDAICDSVEQFILDHGRVPTVTDFKKRSLPPHTVVKKRFGVSLQEWLRQNYPVAKPTEEEKRAEVTEAFVRDYLRIRPKSAEEFNARRTPETHCWYTVAVYNHARCWRKLLSRLELPVYSKTDAPREKPTLKVNILSDYDFKD